MICCEVVSKESKFSIFCFSIFGDATMRSSSSTAPPFYIKSLMKERNSIVMSFHS